MNVEYVRNLHSNYVRLGLSEKPEEKKYQYCIVTRGGIKGLLPCSLRYLDGGAFLYYDITSKQNLVQLHQKGNISREWLLDFVNSLQKLQRELERFLLREENVIWQPQHIFQDLEEPIFSFLYVPYYEGENDFLQLLAFLVEKIDYDDSELVECVYKMYEQVERSGEAYLQEQIFRDVKVLEQKKEKKEQPAQPEGRKLEVADPWENVVRERGIVQPEAGENVKASEKVQEQEPAVSRRIFSLFDTKKNKKGKEQEKREDYQESMQRLINGYAVAEETTYDEEYGRTTFLSQKP